MIAKFCSAALLSAGIALAQSPLKPPPPSTKALAFDVVSIRPSKPGAQSVPPQILPDGYRVHGFGLWIEITNAYFLEDLPFPNRVQGQPSWANNQPYDVEAKVAPTDIPAWQHQGAERKMLQAMLRQMLAERCKLIVHRIPAQEDGYALVVAKSGSKLKPTPPGEIFPPGYMRSRDGGEVVGYTRGEKPQTTYYGTTMPSLASHLSHMTFQHPVVDKTGLTGAYDFVLSWQSMDPNQTTPIATADDANPFADWNVKALGLELKPIKIPTETIVIDHIEMPSQN